MATNTTKTTWILVAHRAGAVLYASHGAGLPLKSVAEIENPDGRLKAGDVESDRPGRAFDRVGGGRHSMSLEDSVPDQLTRAFAQQLVERLERGRLEHAFDGFALVAPPKLLGHLRAELPDALSALLVAALPKDLMRSDGDGVREQLSDLVRL
jgi:protein required for attachment to host cells